MQLDPNKQVFKSDEFSVDPVQWLQEHASAEMDTVLLHTDFGVLWGKVKDKQLTLSLVQGEEVVLFQGDQVIHPENISPEYQSALLARLDALGKTCQQARLFGPGGEWFIWRTPGGFAARLIADGPNDPPDSLPDHQWLWGTLGEKGKPVREFTLLVDGKQGMRHAPPIKELGKNQRVKLTLRHYIEYDAEGQAFITGSRLTGLQKVEEAK